MTLSIAQRQLRERAMPPEAEQHLAQLQTAGLPLPLLRCLVRRGMKTPDQLDLSLQGLHSPRLLKDMEIGAKQLAKAIEAKQRLLIVGDYDADGATATAVLLRGLRRLGGEVDFLVPDRFRFGYGLSPALLDDRLIKSSRPDWIITVDNGVSAIAGVRHAQSLGIQVIVTDHHLPGPELPPCLILNPQLADAGFPSRAMAGVGVAFSLLVAVRAALARLRASDEMPRIDDLLSLVALGTVADLVPLDHNNRRLVAQGLRRIRAGLAPAGLLEILRSAGRRPEAASVEDLGFMVGPRLNAAGRLADMSTGIRCLATDDVEEAQRLASELAALNAERRQLEEEAKATALSLLDDRVLPMEGAGLVVFDEGFHEGVIGLVASRLKDRYHRPTVVFAPAEDSSALKGSGRSIAGVHLRDVIARVDSLLPGLIRAFGGHAMAAGLTLSRDGLPVFESAFQQALDEVVEPEHLNPELLHDGPLKGHEISMELAEAISRQVWGQAMPPPVFYQPFEILQARWLKEVHLKLTVRVPNDSQAHEAIWFQARSGLEEMGLADDAELTGSRLGLAYQLEASEFRGERRLQLLIRAASPV